jgi:GNAT superfamily N-acetyltransferase
MPVEIRRLGVDDLHRVVAAIDRSEHVEVEYEVVDGELRERPVTMADIPPWAAEGEHSAASHFAWLRPLLEAGAHLLVAFDGDASVGATVVVPDYDPPLAWFAFLHVTRSHRRTGVASALWEASTAAARAGGATSMYVSATPTGSAVGFYLSRGCVLADPPRPELFEHEPDDVHLVVSL